jgi:hypothetical protein
LRSADGRGGLSAIGVDGRVIGSFCAHRRALVSPLSSLQQTADKVTV